MLDSDCVQARAVPCAESPPPAPTCGESGKCAKRWAACLDKQKDQYLQCCSDKDECVQRNAFYAQCRPKDQDVPDAWGDAYVVACQRTAHALLYVCAVHEMIGKDSSQRPKLWFMLLLHFVHICVLKVHYSVVDVAGRHNATSASSPTPLPAPAPAPKPLPEPAPAPAPAAEPAEAAAPAPGPAQDAGNASITCGVVARGVSLQDSTCLVPSCLSPDGRVRCAHKMFYCLVSVRCLDFTLLQCPQTIVYMLQRGTCRAPVCKRETCHRGTAMQCGQPRGVHANLHRCRGLPLCHLHT